MMQMFKEVQKLNDFNFLTKKEERPEISLSSHAT